MNNIKYNIMLCKLWNVYSAVYPISYLLLSVAAYFCYIYYKFQKMMALPNASTQICWNGIFIAHNLPLTKRCKLWRFTNNVHCIKPVQYKAVHIRRAVICLLSMCSWSYTCDYLGNHVGKIYTGAISEGSYHISFNQRSKKKVLSSQLIYTSRHV